VKRTALIALAVLACGGAKLPIEQAVAATQAESRVTAPRVGIDLREQAGQLGFVAALSGFRSLVADVLFIQAYVAWERTEWSRVLMLFRQVTTLQPRSVLFWDMAAWHMAWNAGNAALHNPAQPRLALRIKEQREYLELGKDFLERGIKNNPERPQLYEALARLYRDKYKDHARAAEYFALAATKPGAPSYAKRFAAYELSYVEGREQEAYDRLLRLYSSGEQERLPTLISRLKFLEDQLNIPVDQRIPEPAR